jgi:sulfur relay (sulfurtransferase) DsrF/TusC family protein
VGRRWERFRLSEQRDDVKKSMMVVIRCDPEDGPSASEGLRMAVGQSISNRVTVALVDAGVQLVSPRQPAAPGMEDAPKHLEMLARLRQRVWAELESLERHGVDTRRLPGGVAVVERREIDEELLASDGVTVY